MRIALLHPWAWPEVRRGGERYLNDLSLALAARGHQVEVLAGTLGPASRREEPIGDGARTVRLLHHRGVGILGRRGITPVESFGLRVVPSLLRGRFDVVHALTPTAAIAARALGHPTVYTLLGHPQLHHVRAHGGRRSTTAAIERATVVAALSQASAAALRELFGRDAVVLSPGVPLQEFTPELAARTGPPRLLFSGDASDRRKGLDLLLRAFAELIRTHPDVRVQISSATDWRWALDAVDPDRVAVVQRSIDVLGAGLPEEIPGRYRAATLTVLPSSGEAFGMVLVESLASGTPVVCNDDGGMPEIVAGASVGSVVDARDAVALRDALAEVIDLAADAATPPRCVEHARRWGWESIVSDHEAVYESIRRRA